jgi:hypothetical protein
VLVTPASDVELCFAVLAVTGACGVDDGSGDGCTGAGDSVFASCVPAVPVAGEDDGCGIAVYTAVAAVVTADGWAGCVSGA